MTPIRKAHAFSRLVNIMAVLRSPNGCPWDAQQTPASLKPYLLEETYEVMDAIEQGKPDAIRDELGDLLLQVVFLARIFEECGQFDISDVASAIADKLERRHPHVFKNSEGADAPSLDAQWDLIKNREKVERGESTRILAGVPRIFPALLRARKISEKAARVGFDWEEVEGVFAKVREELGELVEAVAHQNPREMEDELGDLLFAVVNLGRFLKIDAEEALRRTIDRFVTRFEYIEQSLNRQGETFQESNLERLEALWEEAKALESASRTAKA